MSSYKKEINRNYIAKDFDSMRLDLQKFAKVFYPDNIQDFSESSIGGMFIDLAAYIGDTMSYYADHQFRELDENTAVESSNIERIAQNAGIKISGVAPSVAVIDFYIRVPAIDSSGEIIPQENALPIIKAGTSLSSTNGIKFSLTEDLNFNKRDLLGNYVARKIKISNATATESFVMVLSGVCVSGEEVLETFTINNNFVPFRTITMVNSDISTILSVTDSEGNEYYEVESLSQDTVFKPFENNETDDVQSNLEVIAAPYRFITSTDIKTRQTTLQFGSGRSDSIIDDGVPDPSELSLPLHGRRIMQRFSLDPSALLNTKTLGISPQSTVITVNYRFGGGASHNIDPGTVNSVDNLLIVFDSGLSGADSIDVRNSIEVSNDNKASGGADRLSIEEIRQLIPTARNLQNRIVTREDLLARLYLLPNEYGRIFRAGIVANPKNPLSSILYIISRDSSGKLTQSPDILKRNISKYLNEFRLISDAIDILDVGVYNFKVNISIMTTPNSNKLQVTKNVIDRIKQLFKIEKAQVGKPIIESDIINTIINTKGALSLISLSLSGVNGTVLGREYSLLGLDFDNIKNNGIYFPPPGGIFELRFPDEDILMTVR